MVSLLDILFFIGLAWLAGAIFLQINLSKKENKWPGLILPGMYFLSILLIVAYMAYMAYIYKDNVFALVYPFTPFSSPAVVFWTFLICNIPTLILMAIYLFCRRKLRKRKALEKMNIQDLD
ncbi:MAG: hypothetical protein FWE85_01320 [Clostridiales bacterium]|nr:hypothetical protein [Clostridiales bacterium]